MSLRFSIEDAVRIVGSEEELRDLAETIIQAADDGEARGQLLNTNAVVPVVVERTQG